MRAERMSIAPARIFYFLAFLTFFLVAFLVLAI